MKQPVASIVLSPLRPVPIAGSSRRRWHVGDVAAIGRDDGSALDDRGHVHILLSIRSDRQAAISAFSRTACISTLAPAVDQSCLMSSLSLWLTPSTQGVKIIEVGVTRAR